MAKKYVDDKLEHKDGSSTSSTTSKPSIHLKVYAPFQVYFEGDVYSLSAVNATGPFDILPNHHNFLCMLVPCDLKAKPISGESVSVKIHRALMHVTANSVVVYMDV